MAPLQWWKNVSIAKKLYFVVGIMALLIAGELVTLRFAMKNLSAARAFVGGESMWSKAQKNAVFSLQRYGITRDEADYRAFLEFLKVNEGDHEALVELLKKDPDRDKIRAGFLQGGIHSDDIDRMTELLRRFYWISYLAKAIDTWVKGDTLLFHLKEAGQDYRTAIISGNTARQADVLSDIKNLNNDLTRLEEDFSYVLGQGSRWLESLVLSILTMAVLTVESIGLTLTFFTSRSISAGLSELNTTAHFIGRGDFSKRVNVKSGDEIGELGEAVNIMGDMLQKSYKELEGRVRERTAELAKMAAENARLYEEAKQAVQTRDEFLSIASHELKTPITSLSLQLQTQLRLINSSLTKAQVPGSGRPGAPGRPSGRDEPGDALMEKQRDMTEVNLKQIRRLTVLLDELLDLTRLRIGKFQLSPEPCELVPVVRDVVTQLNPDAARAGSTVTVHAPAHVAGNFDVTRVSQIVTNLLSNAIKYGAGQPIDVSVLNDKGKALVSIRDNGPGVPLDLQSKIFERFERGTADPHVSGLGLGLYISQQIAKAHGGLITLDSVPGRGATFTMRL